MSDELHDEKPGTNEHEGDPSYPPQVETLHAALRRLVAISRVATGLKNLAVYEPPTYSDRVLKIAFGWPRRQTQIRPSYSPTADKSATGIGLLPRGENSKASSRQRAPLMVQASRMVCCARSLAPSISRLRNSASGSIASSARAFSITKERCSSMSQT